MKRMHVRMIPLAVVVLSAQVYGATTYNWNTNSGTWNDATTNNWSPPGIPAPGDTVNLTLSTNINIDIDFDSANFIGANELEALNLWNDGAGTTKLTIASGDVLSYNDDITIGDGGYYLQTGGAVSNTLGALDWNHKLTMTGGRYRQTGGAHHVMARAYLAYGAAETATMEITGGTLRVDKDISSEYGNLALTISDSGYVSVQENTRFGYGTNDVLWAVTNGGHFGANGFFRIGSGSGASTLLIDNALVDQTDWLHVWTNATIAITNAGKLEVGSMYVNGGRVEVQDASATNYCNWEIYVGSSASYTSGEVVVNGGYIWCRGLLMGVADSGATLPGGGGTFTQNGGQLDVDTGGDIVIGHSNATAQSTYVYNGGILKTWDLKVRRKGTFRGHGAHTQTWGQKLFNTGRIVADGGTGASADTNLDLTCYDDNPLESPVENDSTNGWFAVNRARLMLPQLSVAAGNSTNFWGEPTDDADGVPDMVNSFRMVFTNVQTAGTLAGNLLATDRSDVPSPPALAEFIGVWEMTTGGDFNFGSGDVTLTFRYDDSLRVQQGLPEDLIKVWHYTGDAWQDVTAALNTTDKTVTTTARISFSYYAVSSEPPPPGTVILIR